MKKINKQFYFTSVLVCLKLFCPDFFFFFSYEKYAKGDLILRKSLLKCIISKKTVAKDKNIQRKHFNRATDWKFINAKISLQETKWVISVCYVSGEHVSSTTS